MKVGLSQSPSSSEAEQVCTYNDAVLAYVDIRANLSRIDNTILLNEDVIPDVQRKEGNPAEKKNGASSPAFLPCSGLNKTRQHGLRLAAGSVALVRGQNARIPSAPPPSPLTEANNQQRS